MEKFRKHRTRSHTDRRAKPSSAPAQASRALTVHGDVSASRDRTGSANPNRRISAFLAHLAQQYDGITTQRTRRSERLEAAIAGYDAKKRIRSAPSTLPTHDVKI